MDASTPFKWLDMLEQEFDRNLAFVDLLLDEADFEDAYSADGGSLIQIRSRLSYATGAFGQLVHKALAIFQSNLKLEARVLAAEEDTAQTEARCKTLADEVRSLKAQLAAVSSLNPQKSASILVEQEPVNPDPQILKILEEDAQKRMLSTFRAQLATSQYARLKRENEELKQESLRNLSEMEALRLTLRYLDKERAGRIQQIQLLNNAKMSSDERNHVWSQLETEIALQRCKTVVQTCLVRQQKSNATTTLTSTPKLRVKDDNVTTSQPTVGEIRTVNYERPPENGALGLSIVGGCDVALPIIVSSVSQMSPLAGQIVVGDLIKAANGVDLSTATRQGAVEAIIAPSHKTTNEKNFEMQVCFLGGADDSVYDDELVANGSLNSSVNKINNNKQGDSGLDSSDNQQQYETVWLQNGELWPAIPSGILENKQLYSFPPSQKRQNLPSILVESAESPTEVVINEKVLQASLSSASALLSNAAFNASSRVGSGGGGAMVTLKTGIQPREDDDIIKELAAGLTEITTDLSNNNSSNEADSESQRLDFGASTTLSDIAFAADM